MTLAGPGWYELDELLGEAEAYDWTTVDDSRAITAEEQAMIDRHAAIKVIVDNDITQPYPTNANLGGKCCQPMRHAILYSSYTQK